MRLFEKFSDPKENFKIDLNGQFNTTRKVLPSIEALIQPKQRKAFIKKLFASKESDYEDFIHRLENLKSWKETYQAVEQEFSYRKVNPGKDEAVLFTDILFKRFFQ